MLTLHDEMHLSPVKNPRQVLDIGTGTGIWAIEFGKFKIMWQNSQGHLGNPYQQTDFPP